MADFVCKVADTMGRVYTQVEAAQSISEARQKLSDRGLLVYSVEPRVGLLGRNSGQAGAKPIKDSDFLVFNQQFNTIIKAGLPILKALDLLAERAAAPRLRPLLRDVRDRVREGAALSGALDQQGRFPKVYVTAVLAGEKSGNLTGVLDHYIAYQRLSTGAKRRLVATLIYPAILVLFATLIVTFLITYVVPQFAQLYADMNTQLPTITRLLLVLTVSYRFYLAGLVALAVVSLVVIWFWSRTEQGGVAVDRLKLRLPLLGETWIKFQVAQFCRTLSTLLAGGTPLVGALSTAAESVQSRLISTSISHAADLVRQGQSLHASLKQTGLMPEVGLEMIEVGEASGALAPMLGSVAELYDEEVGTRLERLFAILGPAILVFMAVLIAFVLLALYMPIFSLSSGVGIG